MNVEVRIDVAPRRVMAGELALNDDPAQAHHGAGMDAPELVACGATRELMRYLGTVYTTGAVPRWFGRGLGW